MQVFELQGKYLVFFMVVKKMYIFQWLKKICKNCFTLRLYTS